MSVSTEVSELYEPEILSMSRVSLYHFLIEELRSYEFYGALAARGWKVLESGKALPILGNCTTVAQIIAIIS